MVIPHFHDFPSSALPLHPYPMALSGPLSPLPPTYHSGNYSHLPEGSHLPSLWNLFICPWVQHAKSLESKALSCLSRKPPVTPAYAANLHRLYSRGRVRSVMGS